MDIHDKVKMTEPQNPAKSVPKMGDIITDAISRPIIANVNNICKSPNRTGIPVENFERHRTSLSKSDVYKYVGCIFYNVNK